MMYRKILTLFVIVPALLFSEDSDIGTTAFQGFDVGFGARPMAMGGAFIALSNDITAIHWNPGGLGFMPRNQLFFSHQKRFMDMTYECGGIGWRFPIGVVSGGVTYASSGEVEAWSNANEERGIVAPYQALVQAGYAREMTRHLSAGMSAKGFYDNLIDDMGRAYAFDAGLLWKSKRGPLSVRHISESVVLIGLNVRNVGTTVSYLYEGEEKLPRRLQAGAGFVMPNLAFMLGGDMPSYGVPCLRVGLEFWVLKMLALRAGYRRNLSSLRHDDTRWDHLSGGVGIDFKNINVDYAYVPYGDLLGSTHRISLGLSFGREPWQTGEGVVTIHVCDQETRDPLGAAVAMVGVVSEKRTTDEETGDLKLTDVPEGSLVVVVQNELYKPVIGHCFVRADRENRLELAMEALPVVEFGTGLDVTRIFGLITPVPAILKCGGPVFREIETSQDSGYAITDIPPGIYTVSVEAKKHDYFPQTVGNVEVREGKGTLLNLELGKVKVCHLYFETAESYVHPADYAMLDSLAVFMRAYPENNFKIHGHTDSRGTRKYNIALSKKRAEAVEKYLIKRAVSPKRLTSRGFGPDRAIAPNTTKENLAMNRRIEIILER